MCEVLPPRLILALGVARRERLEVFVHHRVRKLLLEVALIAAMLGKAQDPSECIPEAVMIVLRLRARDDRLFHLLCAGQTLLRKFVLDPLDRPVFSTLRRLNLCSHIFRRDHIGGDID